MPGQNWYEARSALRRQRVREAEKKRLEMDAKIQEVLSACQDPIKEFETWISYWWKHGSHRGHQIQKVEQAVKRTLHLMRKIRKKAPKVLQKAYYHALYGIASEEWVRDLDDWKPQGKSPNTQMRSLIDHLLVKYPVPQFLYCVFQIGAEIQKFRGDTFLGDPPRTSCFRPLFIHLTQGGSMKQALSKGLIKAKMTQKMCHLFLSVKTSQLTATNEDAVIEAVRLAQVEALGGDRRLAHILAMSRQLNGFGIEGTALNEEFWFSIIQWFCNQAMLDPNQVGPMLDYIEHARMENIEYSIKGRTAQSVIRAMEAWHGEVAQDRKINGEKYEPSGFKDGIWESWRRTKGGKVADIWILSEILTSKELSAESKAMKHCVWSYGYSIRKGQCSIWSLKLNDQRMLTVEVLNRERRITQYRGRLNRKASPKEVSILRRWAKENGLVHNESY